ncbi:MAG: hypothetical protein V7L12_16530 [Nostoc sp.]
MLLGCQKRSYAIAQESIYNRVQGGVNSAKLSQSVGGVPPLKGTGVERRFPPLAQPAAGIRTLQDEQPFKIPKELIP